MNDLSNRAFAFPGHLYHLLKQPVPPSDSQSQLTGVLERIIFLNEENHYTIAEFRPEVTEAVTKPEPVTLVGTLPGVECGETLHVNGEWTKTTQYGAQFKVLSFKSELPASVYGIRKYLGSGLVPGIGKVYANKIVDAFGTQTFRILSEESGRLRDVEGIGKKRATAIKQAWDSKRTERELYIFLQTYGVSPTQCVKLVDRYGAQAKQILMNEPYRVAREIDGIGFKTADKIAINLGFANDAPPRLDGGLLFALETLQEEGHTAYREAELREYAGGLLETSAERLDARINALVDSKQVIRHQPIGVADPLPGSALIQLPQSDRAEQKITGAVGRLGRVVSGLPPIKVEAAVEWAEKKAGFAFHELQREGVKNALSHKFTILTGGPGTGKAQPIDSKVLTANGFRSIGSLDVGDEIISPLGDCVRVTGKFPQGRKQVYRIDFADGRSCESCEDHLWKVWTRVSVWDPEKKKKVRSRDWRVVPLKYINERLTEGRSESDRIGIPLLLPNPTGAPAQLPCDPYLLGALIGDGTLKDSVQFTTTDSSLIHRITEIVAPLGLRLNNVSLHDEKSTTWRIVGRGKGHSNPLRNCIVELGLNVTSQHKFVPEIYFTGNLNQRLELLRGLLDIDGTVDTRGVVSFTSSSFRLANDVKRLAWSLGCIATSSAVRRPSYTHKGENRIGLEAHTVILQHRETANFFTLARKQSKTKRQTPRLRFSHRLRITKITSVEEKQCVCISVSGPDGLYITDNYIVTHNTTILRALVEILKAKKVRVHLAAPTGRAAQRLAETTGGFASTIHRLLKYDAATGGFTSNENRPLATDFLIVDEASMLDSRLAAALLQAVPSKAHLLLVGDIDQLPSVGAGNVLKDLIATNEIPVTRLSVIYRQTGQSAIVTTAHAINAGDTTLPAVANEIGTIQVWNDLTFVTATDAEDCLKKVIALCTEFIPQKIKWPDPIGDVQVLAPMHKGVVGVGNLNAQLQAALNPHNKGLRFGPNEYRPGDKIIQLKNNYDKNLFNGDIGRVLSVDPQLGTLTADFDGARHEFDRGELGSLSLALAISIHKSQGSEYPIVIVPLLKGHFMMLQRNLLYTAITRGRKKVFIVGEPAAYGMAVRNNESKLRVTHLKEKIALMNRGKGLSGSVR